MDLLITKPVLLGILVVVIVIAGVIIWGILTDRWP
jgi:hypothetical protein